jgi:BMFP domain-containing protein YqiC
MINQDSIESLAKRISALLPADVTPVKEDIESSIRNLLQGTLAKMQLVTREEFDVQSAVLQRTRDKLEQLEKQLEALQTQDGK